MTYSQKEIKEARGRTQKAGASLEYSEISRI
jgi:hypothetical protein